MIFHQHSCIFIHIPKTAGTSIEQKLAGEKPIKHRQDHRSIRNLENALVPDSFGRIFSADMLRYIYQNYSRRRAGLDKHTREQFQRYYKFSFVRNPWARAYSWYRNVIRDEYHRRQHGLNEDCSLSELLVNQPDSWALRSQLSWLTGLDGNIGVDFIGRFENLQEDFNKVCHHIGLSDCRLRKTLVGGNCSYLTEYDDFSRRLIAERYAEDIEYFGYRFGS